MRHLVARDQVLGTPAAPLMSRPVRIIAVIIVLGVLATAGGYYAYESSLQPNIQATSLQFTSPVQNPQTNTIQDNGRVSNSGSFSYTATVNGSAYLVFDNTFSFSSKAVAVSYTAAGVTSSKAFTISGRESNTLQIPLNSGQSVSGTFTVSGGSGNDVNFSIQQYTCSQSESFSLVLVNSGSANGYVTLSFITQGRSHVYSNKFFVIQGQQLPVSGSLTIPDCLSQTLSPSLSQTKG